MSWNLDNIALGWTGTFISGGQPIIYFNDAGTVSAAPTTGSFLYSTADGLTVKNAGQAAFVIGTGGSGGGLPTTTNFGEYLYSNGSSFVVGSGGITLGYNAGTGSLAQINIGTSAGNSSIYGNAQSIAIGYDSGFNNGVNSISIGTLAEASSTGSVCIGSLSTAFGVNSVRLGSSPLNQVYELGQNCVAIGYNTMNGGATGSPLASNIIAIGTDAGYNQPGSNSINIGNSAGVSNFSSVSNYTILNSSGFTLNAQQSNALYIAPVRIYNDPGAAYVLQYNNSTNEVTASTSSTIRVNSVTGAYYNTTTPQTLTISGVTQAVPGLAVSFTTPSQGNWLVRVDFQIILYNASASLQASAYASTIVALAIGDSRYMTASSSEVYILKGSSLLTYYGGVSPNYPYIYGPSVSDTCTVRLYGNNISSATVIYQNTIPSSGSSLDTCSSYVNVIFSPA